MKIGIVGGGSIGLLYAYYFRKQMQEVTIYTRTQEQADALLKDGVTCVRNGERDKVSVQARCWTDGLYADDYVLFAVKQYHLPELLEYILKKTACEHFVFLQNGMSHISMLENMTQNIAAGIVEHGAKKKNATTVEHTGNGTTKLGIIQGKPESFEPFLRCFKNGVFPVTAETDWLNVMTNKLIINACINPLTALYGVKNGVLLRNPFLFRAMQLVFEEAIDVLRVRNREEQWKRVQSVCEKTANNHSSMLMDVKHGRKTEVEAIIGHILTEADKQNKPAPILRFLYYSIKGLENERR